MKMLRLIPILLIIAWPSVLAAQAAESAGGESSSEFRRNYGVIVDQNIFRRDRRAPQPVQTAPTTDTPPSTMTPEQSMMLTGLVIEQGHVRAYFENLQTGQVLRVSTGDALARGQVMDITLDALAYESEGQVVWVEIGQDLTGAVASITVAPAASTGATTGQVDPATLSLEERMRLRRRQLQN